MHVTNTEPCDPFSTAPLCHSKVMVCHGLEPAELSSGHYFCYLEILCSKSSSSQMIDGMTGLIYGQVVIVEYSAESYF